MRTIEVYYSVRLNRKSDGTPYLALGKGSTPALFYRHRDAVKFKRELAEHGMPGKVARVEVAYFFED